MAASGSSPSGGRVGGPRRLAWQTETKSLAIASAAKSGTPLRDRVVMRGRLWLAREQPLVAARLWPVAGVRERPVSSWVHKLRALIEHVNTFLSVDVLSA